MDLFPVTTKGNPLLIDVETFYGIANIKPRLFLNVSFGFSSCPPG